MAINDHCLLPSPLVTEKSQAFCRKRLMAVKNILLCIYLDVVPLPRFPQGLGFHVLQLCGRVLFGWAFGHRWTDFLGWTAFVLGVGTALLQLPEVSLHPPCSEQGPLSLREPPDNAVEPTTPTTLKTVLLPTSSYLSTSNVRHFYFVHWSVYQPLLFCTNHRAFPVLLF